MSRTENLYKLQLLDSEIDRARKRIAMIESALTDSQEVLEAEARQRELESLLEDKNRLLRKAEDQVNDQAFKLEGNQKKLYSGSISNPKELEDLQLEANSLKKYLGVLEDQQLDAMLEVEKVQKAVDEASSTLAQIQERSDSEHLALQDERSDLQETIASALKEKDLLLSKEDLPDLDTYQRLRETLGGIAVALMISGSCSACGSHIPSAIEQESRSPTKLAFCPTCKRILHPE